MPEHNFLLSMGNDGACRVLDYLQVGVANILQGFLCSLCVLKRASRLPGRARLVYQECLPLRRYAPRRTRRFYLLLPPPLDTTKYFDVVTLAREARS